MDFWHIVQNPHLLHATVVHFPVALGLLGLPLILVAGMAKMRPGIRYACLGLYVLVAVSAFGAQFTGLQIAPASVPAGAKESLEMHSMAAAYVWIAAATTAFLVLLTGIQSEWFRAVFTVLAVLSSLATTAMICTIGFYGQMLVYEYGVTSDSPPAAAVPAPATAPPHSPQADPAPQTAPPAPPAVPAPQTAPPAPPAVPAPQAAPPAPPADAAEPNNMLEGIDPVRPVTPPGTRPAPGLSQEPPKSQITLKEPAPAGSPSDKSLEWRKYATSQWRAVLEWGKGYLW